MTQEENSSKIGIYIEEYKPDEILSPLTKEEMKESVYPVIKQLEQLKIDSNRRGIGWIGYWSLREYGAISFKANKMEINITNCNNWVYGCEIPPNDEYKKWVIEFPVFNPKHHFVRRYFFFKSKYNVPDVLARRRRTHEEILRMANCSYWEKPQQYFPSKKQRSIF